MKNMLQIPPSGAMAMTLALLLQASPSWSDRPVRVVHPATVAENSSTSDDALIQAQMASLREKYQQDRQALKARSAQLPPEERMRLHKELLESHQAAMAKLEQEQKDSSASFRERWQERRDRRSERLEEVRKDGTAHKRRHDKNR